MVKENQATPAKPSVAANVVVLHNAQMLLQLLAEARAEAAEVAVLAESLAGWRRVFPTTYDETQERVLLMLGFEDHSWHNDISARFSRRIRLAGAGTVDCDVWISEACREDREVQDMARYTAYFYRSETTDDYIAGSELRDRRIESEDFGEFLTHMARVVFRSDMLTAA